MLRSVDPHSLEQLWRSMPLAILHYYRALGREFRLRSIRYFGKRTLQVRWQANNAVVLDLWRRQHTRAPWAFARTKFVDVASPGKWADAEVTPKVFHRPDWRYQPPKVRISKAEREGR